MPELQNSKRRMDLDYAKGIAILLMIFMHTGNPSDYQFKICISAFFMPIFYIICGMLAAIKNPNGLTEADFPQYMVKRYRQILVPYFVFGAILILFFQALHLISGAPLTIKSQLFCLFSLQGIESMWFLTRYFLAEMLFLFVMVRQHKIMRLSIAMISVVAISAMNMIGMPDFWLFRVFVGAWLGLVFVYFGFVIERYQLIQNLGRIFVLILFVVCTASSLYNGFIGVGALNLQNGILFFANGLGLSIVLLYFCRQLKGTNRVLSLLTVFGKNTIVIVCTNNLVIEIIRLLDYKLTGNILLQMGLLGNFLFAGILVTIECFLIQVFQGNAGILFGRK